MPKPDEDIRSEERAELKPNEVPLAEALAGELQGKKGEEDIRALQGSRAQLEGTLNETGIFRVHRGAILRHGPNLDADD
jgi:hypothetical protein